MPINAWADAVHLGDVFHDDAITYTERRDEIVRRLRAHRWVAHGRPYLQELVDELAEAATTAEFDAIWTRIYDMADADRIWIETIRSAPGEG